MLRTIMSNTRNLIVGASLLVICALVLAGCGTSNRSSSSSSRSTPVATQDIPPSSVCGTNGDYVHQSLNGDFEDCLRVPALYSSTEVVSLQSYLLGTRSSGPTTTFLPSGPEGPIVLSLGTNTTSPGREVTITGRFLADAPTARQRQDNATVCWDGCQNGLQEQGVAIHWTSPTTFSTSLEVPETAWLTTRNGVVSVHPLRSGRYEVGVACLDAISGCALGPSQAETPIHLIAPKPSRCVTAKRCETMSLNPSTAQVGQEIVIKGWAPLEDIIGQPFGLSVSVTKGPGRQHYAPLSYSQNLKGGGFDVVLSPRVLHVAASATWASLGTVPYLSSTFAGASTIQPVSGSNVVASCLSTGLEITGGHTQMRIPTSTVASALRGTGLNLFSSPASNPTCSSVVLDSNDHDSIYAGFDTAQNDSAPPIYVAGLYTTDDGANWRTIPVPASMSLEDFAGFSIQGNRVDALYEHGSDYSSKDVPPGTDHGLVDVEVTANGGASWSTSTLGCPRSGPCTMLGPDQWGNCAMNGESQPVLTGPTGEHDVSGVRWSDTFWSSTVNSCFSQQLVATSAKDLLLVDPSSQYPLVRSNDSGQTWSYVALPKLKAAQYGPDSISMSNALLFAPNSYLYVVVTSPSGTKQALYALKPKAKEWCVIPHVFGSDVTSGTVGELRVDRSELLWMQTIYPTSGAASSRLHVVSLARLHC